MYLVETKQPKTDALLRAKLGKSWMIKSGFL